VKIVEVQAYHIRVPLRRPIRHASHSRDSTDNVVVRVRLDNGTVGFGEGVPRDYVTGETAEGAVALLGRSSLAAQFGPCYTFDAALVMAEELRLADVPGDERGIGGNAARCALELALLDAYGKHFNEPLSSVTRKRAPELYDPKPEVRYSGVITSSRSLKLRLSALVQRIYGFHHMKIKVGIPGYDDAKRLRTIRGCVGAAMDLRIDANEAWSVNEVVSRIKALSPVGISCVEQPVRHEDVACLADVRKQVPEPIMLDESLCGVTDAERAITGKTCDVFNVRLSKCGGFLASLKLAKMAKAAGLACQLGCHPGETAILSAAGRHFAASVGGLRYVEGSYDKRVVREALGDRDLTFGYGGKAPALTGGGLGVNIREEALARVAVNVVRLV
jgi:L-alanine-DL-glutamate epimerase-like enolase superfamily enzyme